jgi:hypothetical protein
MKTGKMKTSKMKTSINLKTRKMKNNYLKLVMMAAVMLSASIGFAQTTSGSIGKSANTTLGSAGGSVKVIDNKGTIKYLQSNNGLTTFTDTAPDGGVVTTWQLGGTLTEDTNITTGAQEFKISLATPSITVGGVTTPATQGTFILDGVLQEFGNASDAATIGISGYTFLVRDELTGQVKKMLASDLITGIRQEYVQGTDVNANIALEPNATVNVDIVVTGLQILDATTSAKLSVYRNGVKLRFGTDFTVETDGAVAPTISVQIPISGDVPLYEADVVEIQYVN